MEKQSSLEQMVININEAFQRANEEFYANRGPPKSTVSMKEIVTMRQQTVVRMPVYKNHLYFTFPHEKLF